MLRLVGMSTRVGDRCPMGVVSVDSRWSRCASKMSYPSKGVAIMAASHGCTISQSSTMRPYKCPYCHRWHLISCSGGGRSCVLQA
jgi:hypothetical protein